MGKSVNNNKEPLSIPTMIFAIIGIVLVVLGFMLAKNNSFRMQIISTEGTVSGIQTATDNDGNLVSKSYTLTYNANKSDYTATIRDSGKNLEMGNTITLYYDLFEPTSVSDKRGGYQGYIALILGIILVLKNGSRFYRIIRDNYIMS